MRPSSVIISLTSATLLFSLTVQGQRADQPVAPEAAAPATDQGRGPRAAADDQGSSRDGDDEASDAGEGAAPGEEANAAQAPSAAPEAGEQPSSEGSVSPPEPGAPAKPFKPGTGGQDVEGDDQADDGTPAGATDDAAHSQDDGQADAAHSQDDGQADDGTPAGATDDAAPSQDDGQADGIATAPRPPGEAELLDLHPVSTITFKPGTGAVFKSADGLFSMGIRARVQLRNDVEFEEDEADGDLLVRNTFGIRRARVQFKGYVFGEHNQYKAELAFSPRDLGYEDGVVTRTPLLTWYAQFTHLRDLSLRLGQYKLFYSRQRVISSGNLEFVDRTLAQGEFNLDRDIGFQFFSQDLLGLERLKYYAGVTLGEGRDVWASEDFFGERQATAQTEGRPAGEGGFQYLARFEYLPFGDFDDYSEVDFSRERRLRASLGVAYALLDNGSRARGYQGSAFDDGGTVDYHNVAADIFFKYAGLTGLAEFYLREGSRGEPLGQAAAVENLARDGVGYTAQLAYLLPGLPVDIGLRYSGITPLGEVGIDTAVESRNELGTTVGWYMAGHPLKLQADYFHMWQTDFAERADERVRVQLQLAY